MPPFLLKTEDNPQGVFQRADIEGAVEAIRTDRLADLTYFIAARPLRIGQIRSGPSRPSARTRV